jgi:hypothetical protein
VSRMRHLYTCANTRARREDLVYIADEVADAVDVYSYPQLKRVGRIRSKAPVGDCVDNLGDVWIVNGGNQTVVEYPHGGVTSIQRLPLGKPVDTNFQGCAVDPSTGNLAVTAGVVYVFPHAKSPAKKYTVHIDFWRDRLLRLRR